MTSALRDAVARLMATGDADLAPWWHGVSLYGHYCRYCNATSKSRPSFVRHDDDCPALAVEAAMREEVRE